MKKKYLYIFCIVGCLLVVLVAALLIGDNGGLSGAPAKTTSTTTGRMETFDQSNGTDDQIPSDSTEHFGTVDTQTSGEDFEAEFGAEDGKPTLQSPQPDTESAVTQATQPQATQPTSPPATEGTGMPDVLLTYEQFLQLSAAEQDAYFLQFVDPRDYSAWLRKAKEEYEDNQTSIIITGPIDLSTLPANGD